MSTQEPSPTSRERSLSSPRFQYALRSSRMVSLNAGDNYQKQKNRHTLTACFVTVITRRSIGIRKLVDLAYPAYFSLVFQFQQFTDQMLEKLNPKVDYARITSMVNDYLAALTPSSRTGKTKICGPTNRAWILLSSTSGCKQFHPPTWSFTRQNAGRITVVVRLDNKVYLPPASKLKWWWLGNMLRMLRSTR